MLEQFVPGALPKMATRKKFECNVAALRILATLEVEKREATREERAALALYTGWGDTEVRRHAFDWAGRPTDELVALGLNEAVLEGMRRSVLNAHYTDMGVVDAMWQIAQHLGFASLKGPRVLEPSAGVGHFIGRAPYDTTDLRPEAVVGVELDAATHAVCRALYPRCDVRRGGFEQQELPSSFDLIIGNVPFGDYGVSDDRLPEGCRHQIHDYFICRSVDLLRPGGVAILITSKGTLDKKNPFVRRWLAERADLLGAFRLPSDAFADNAGTEVTTDVLVLQRLTRDQPGRETDWLELGEVSYVDRWGGQATEEVNLHFITHPDHVFGVWGQNKLGRGVGVTRREGEERSAGQMLTDALGTLPGAVLQKTRQKAPSRAVDVKGELTLASPQELACGRVLRAVRAILARDSAGARRLLRVAYNSYKSAYGSLRQAESHRRHPLSPFTGERWWPLVASLEDDAGRECGFLVSQPTTDAARPKPECALDAMYQLLDESGSFDLDRVAERLGTDREAARVELRGAAFQLGPDGPWETAERYLCGDVVGKLDEARRWASVDAAFAENVTALERVQPERVTLGGDDGFTVPFGAPWVPTTVYASFLAHLFPAFRQRLGYSNSGNDALWGATLRYVEATATWVFDVTDKHVLGSVENTRTYGTKRLSAVEIMEYGLKLQIPTVYDDLADGKRVRNEVESAAAQAKLAEIRDRWTAWLPADEERKTLLEDSYNRRFNRMRVRTYDGSRLTFPGLSPTYQGKPLSPYPHQRAGAQRVLERGEKDDTAMIAYMPGAGKTLTAILGVVKRLQLGLSSKAVIVVPKNVLGQWQDAFYALYPGLADWLLPGSDRAFDAANRRRFLLQAATGGAKVILLTYEQFRSVSIQPETFRAYLRREVLDLEQALIGTAEDDPSQRGLQRAFKQREKALADFEAKYEDKWKKVQKAGESDLSWEKWGVDLLVSDEFHSFKGDIVLTKMQGVSGLPRGESQRAFDMRVKLHYVTTPELFVGLEPRDGGKAVALTGTPVTNSLAETWIMLRHLQPRLLREYGLWHFDAWAATFTTQVACPEMDATGGWRLRTRLKFHNLPELQDILGLCWDRVDPRLAGGKRPSIVGDRMRVVETQGSAELREYTQQLADRADLVRKRQVDPEEDNMLKITHDGRVASLFNGFPQDTWPTRVTKLDACVDEVWTLYCHSDDASGVQLVFVDLFTPKANSDATLTDSEVFEQQGIYGILKQKLIRKGMLSSEVEFVHDAASDDERSLLFERANAGKVRVLIGSTARMGLGVNVQRRAYAVHHLTVPWRPDWLDQANKRVDRDGNTMEAVHIVCYPTTGSYDVVLWQLIETKATFVAAINSGTYAGRSADDIGDLVIDATTAKAIALGDLRVVEKVKLELELNSLQRQYRMWKNDNSRSNFEAQSLPRQIAEKDGTIADLTRLKTHRDANQLRTFAAKLRPPMGGVGDDSPSTWITLTDRTRADHLVRSLSESLRGKLTEDGMLVGQYRGLDLLLRRDNAGIHLECTLPGGADVEAKNVHLAGTSAFVVLETQLAALETQIYRLNTQRSILSQRLATLQATALAWSHKDRALSTLARYDDLCSQIATAGIVDRQTFRFD